MYLVLRYTVGGPFLGQLIKNDYTNHLVVVTDTRMPL